jgi:hypothetical protein
MNRTRAIVSAAVAAAAFACAVSPAARALPPPSAPEGLPRPVPTVTATPAVSGAVLPYGSPIFFVIDDKVSSGSTAPGTIVHMHLRDPLVLEGTTIALKGTPATFTVVSVAKAASGDINGAIQIHLDPLTLAGGLTLPIRAFHEYLTMEMTGGMVATRSTTDTIEDVFIPYAPLYQILRKGHQMVLPVGSVLRAETDATLDATHPKALVISTPPPFVSTFDPPHADLTAAPFYTPAPMRPHPLPHGRPTLPPKPSPSPETADTAAPAASAAPPAVPAVAGSPAVAVPAAPSLGSAAPSPSVAPSTTASPSR